MKKNKIVNKTFVVIGSDGKAYKIIESTEMLQEKYLKLRRILVVGLKPLMEEVEIELVILVVICLM